MPGDDSSNMMAAQLKLHMNGTDVTRTITGGDA